MPSRPMRTILLFFSLFALALSSAKAQPRKIRLIQEQKVRVDTVIGPHQLVAVPAALPNQDSADDRPCFTLDGRMMYFGSRRASNDKWRQPDPNPNWKWDSDLWYRILTDTGWSSPINVGAPINNSAGQLNPTISPRGDVLYYVSGGGQVLWMAKQNELPKPPSPAKAEKKSGKNSRVKKDTIVSQPATPVTLFKEARPVSGLLNRIRPAEKT